MFMTLDVRVDRPDATDPEVIDTAFVSQMGQVAERAFDHWLRVMRWRTRSWRIGRMRKHQRTKRGTTLREDGTNRQLAPTVQTIVVRQDRPFTVEEWSDTQDALANGRESPLFYDLFFDGQEHRGCPVRC